MNSVYEDDNVVVQDSPIEGCEVFAKRDFKKGEVILKWNPLMVVTHENRSSIPESEQRYINKLQNGTEVLMNIPERYVNHSCTSNTAATDDADVAIRDIHAGEELTAHYLAEEISRDFECHCGSTNCVSKS